METFFTNYNVMIPYRDGMKWGYADTNATIIIKPVYDSVSFFYDNWAFVFNKKGSNKVSGIIDQKGAVKIPIIYDSISVTKKSYLAYKNNKVNIFNNKYQNIHKQEFKEIVIIEDDYFVAKNDKGKYAAFLVNEKEAIQNKFFSNVEFIEGKYHFFTGENIVYLFDQYAEPKVFLVKEKEENGAFPMSFPEANNTQEYNKSNSVINRVECFTWLVKLKKFPKYEELKQNLDGMTARIKINNKWGVIDCNEKVIVPIKYQEIIADYNQKEKNQYSQSDIAYSFSNAKSENAIYFVKDRDRWGIHNYHQEIINPSLESYKIHYISHGDGIYRAFIVGKKGKKEVLVNLYDGKVSAEYDYINVYEQPKRNITLLVLKDGDKYHTSSVGIISNSDSTKYFYSNLQSITPFKKIPYSFKIKKENKYALIDIDYFTIRTPFYEVDDIVDTLNLQSKVPNAFIIAKKGKFGLVFLNDNRNDIEPLYDTITVDRVDDICIINLIKSNHTKKLIYKKGYKLSNVLFDSYIGSFYKNQSYRKGVNYIIKENKIGYIDIENSFFTGFNYDSIVLLGKRVDILDIEEYGEEKQKLERKKESVHNIYFVKVCDNGDCGVINIINNEKIVENKYDDVFFDDFQSASLGSFRVKSNNKLGVVQSNKLVINTEFDLLNRLGNNAFEGMKNDKAYIVFWNLYTDYSFVSKKTYKKVFSLSIVEKYDMQTRNFNYLNFFKVITKENKIGYVSEKGLEFFKN